MQLWLLFGSAALSRVAESILAMPPRLNAAMRAVREAAASQEFIEQRAALAANDTDYFLARSYQIGGGIVASRRLSMLRRPTPGNNRAAVFLAATIYVALFKPGLLKRAYTPKTGGGDPDFGAIVQIQPERMGGSPQRRRLHSPFAAAPDDATDEPFGGSAVPRGRESVRVRPSTRSPSQQNTRGIPPAHRPRPSLSCFRMGCEHGLAAHLRHGPRL
jgi:hypothetical protein